MDSSIDKIDPPVDEGQHIEVDTVVKSPDNGFSLDEFVKDNQDDEHNNPDKFDEDTGKKRIVIGYGAEDQERELKEREIRRDAASKKKADRDDDDDSSDTPSWLEPIRLVNYKHGTKAQRMGRQPLVHKDREGRDLSLSEDSVKNHDNSKFMLYRLDDLPVDGPGSRGGKQEQRVQKGKLTPGSLRKKKQSQLTFGENVLSISKKEQSENSEPVGSEDVPVSDLAQETPTPKVEQDTAEPAAESPAPAATESELQASEEAQYAALLEAQPDTPEPFETMDITQALAQASSKSGKSMKPRKISVSQMLKKQDKGKVSDATKKRRKPSGPKLPTTSRTTVLTNVHKLTRQFPGPVIPLCYELYDDNLINATPNKEAKQEKIALGFDVKPAPYAGDVMFLISFCSRFKDVIELGKFGPQDIEEGLGLDNLQDPAPVSKFMNQLFCKLVTLVLNRKPEVNPKLQGKAVSELKAVCGTLGLPREWKDKTEMYQPVKLSDDKVQPVDESKPEILLDEGYVFHPPFIYENPFNDKQGFEKYGFPGIANPLDRLIMLRTLAQWSLSSSNDIRAAFNHSVQKQDIPGDKETFYASRALLKGFKHTEDLTKEINEKIAKKKYSEDNDSVARYVEPISDPLQHSLRFRVEDMVVGDLGFNVGRFYFCRISDSKDGGLTSMANMKQAWTNPGITRASTACRFKLYVQDVHKMLVDQLASEGVEFDSKGREVVPPVKEQKPGSEEERPPANEEYPDLKFYEVASTTEELDTFVAYLESRLGIVQAEDHKVPIIPAKSPLHKPVQSLYEYLSSMAPLVRQQSEMVLEERSSRKRTVDYSDASASKKTKIEEESDNNDDFEYEDEEVPVEQDDEEDDDYMD